MAFSLGVEALNIRMRKRHEAQAREPVKAGQGLAGLNPRV